MTKILEDDVRLTHRHIERLANLLYANGQLRKAAEYEHQGYRLPTAPIDEMYEDIKARVFP